MLLPACCLPAAARLLLLQKGSGKLGYESEAFAIYDTMRYIKPAVATVCVGSAFGEAAMLLAAGEAGRRAALPSASIMIRQPIQRFTQMQASDIDIYRNELRKTNAEVVRAAPRRRPLGFRRAILGAEKEGRIFPVRSSPCPSSLPPSLPRPPPPPPHTHPTQVRLLSFHTGHSEAEIAGDIARPKYFNPYEAVDYGIIDRVLEPDDEAVKAVVRAAQQAA